MHETVQTRSSMPKELVDKSEVAIDALRRSAISALAYELQRKGLIRFSEKQDGDNFEVTASIGVVELPDA